MMDSQARTEISSSAGTRIRDVELAPSGRVAAVAREVSNEAVQRLLHDLEGKVTGEVRFDAGSRALYATDASNYRQVPLGVVLPRNVDDVVATVAACHKHQVPLVSRGG